MTLLAGVILAGLTAFAQADDPPPVTSTISVQAVVPGAIPKNGPIITAPANGQRFTSNPINIRGTCQSGLLVNVYKNDVLAGAVICDRTGQFAMQADLFIGQNKLVAKMLNQANQSSPDSNEVIAYYDLPSSPLNVINGSVNGQNGNVIIKAPSIYKGSVPGQNVSWEVEVLGGQAPYAVSVDWGDGTSNLFTRTTPGKFTITHTYKKAGGYKGSYVLTIKAVDSVGTAGLLQLAAIVNNDVGAALTTSRPTGGQLLLAWPIWALLLLMVVSFWLGEWRGRKAEERGLPQTPALGT